MTSHAALTDLAGNGIKKLWSVSDFAKRYRLDGEEEARLVSLLGRFATEQDLLINASRAPRYRQT
jgi:hypothetical protein